MSFMLVINNGSFYNTDLLSFLSNKKINFDVMQYSDISISKLDKFDSFIITGRKSNNNLMNVVNSKIINHSILKKKSLLGICYGAEILALTLGSTIVRMSSAQRGVVKIDILKKNKLCNKKIYVFKNHRYKISRLGESISCLASSKNCMYEIIQYNDLNIFGTQFHPEVTIDGKSFLESFVLLW